MTTKNKELGELPDGVWETEEEIKGVDLGVFEMQCKALFQLDKEIELAESKVKVMKERAEEMKSAVMAIMKKYHKSKYPVEGFGTVKIAKRFSWKIPQDMPSKEQFFAYLKKKGIFMELVGVNSQTLNSFCKQELENAKARGEVDWNPPGLEQPTHSEKIQLTSR